MSISWHACQICAASNVQLELLQKSMKLRKMNVCVKLHEIEFLGWKIKRYSAMKQCYEHEALQSKPLYRFDTPLSAPFIFRFSTLKLSGNFINCCQYFCDIFFFISYEYVRNGKANFLLSILYFRFLSSIPGSPYASKTHMHVSNVWTKDTFCDGRNAFDFSLHQCLINQKWLE